MERGVFLKESYVPVTPGGEGVASHTSLSPTIWLEQRWAPQSPSGQGGAGSVHIVVQTAAPAAVLLVDLAHGQDTVQHALKHAFVHGDDRVPQRRLGDARSLWLQVEHVVAVSKALGAVAGKRETRIFTQVENRGTGRGRSLA